jgi:hypothetical protein
VAMPRPDWYMGGVGELVTANFGEFHFHALG